MNSTDSTLIAAGWLPPHKARDLKARLDIARRERTFLSHECDRLAAERDAALAGRSTSDFAQAMGRDLATTDAPANDAARTAALDDLGRRGY